MRLKRCSKCCELGHYKNTCRNPRANFDADYEADVVAVEDLLGEIYDHVFAMVSGTNKGWTCLVIIDLSYSECTDGVT